MDSSLGNRSAEIAVIPSEATGEVEGSRGASTKLRSQNIATFPEARRDPSTPLRSARDDRRGETAAHLQLKRLALLWAQENGYPICALEVALPKSRYRADVAAYRPQKDGRLGVTAIFECKQSTPDFRRDDCRSPRALALLETLFQRRQILERNLRVHYPTLRTGDTLFPEWEAHDFTAIRHRGYARVTRELAALQRQLRDGRKFEKIARYTCANLFFLVSTNELVREAETPLGWGLLVETGGSLTMRRKPVWHDSSERARLRVLQKIAAAGTRLLNRQQGLASLTIWSRLESANAGSRLR